MGNEMKEAEAKLEPRWTTFKSGVTGNSALAILYALLTFTPAAIYMQLMTGGVRMPVAWFTLLLWIELAGLAGKKISKQEAFIILSLAGVASYPLGMVYRVWYQSSAIAEMFDIADYLPHWWVPQKSAGIMTLRTFFHPSWIVPIAVVMITTLFMVALDIGLSLLGREIFIETERLPFPLLQIDAATVITMAEKKKGPIQILTLSATLSFIYGFVLYAMPVLHQAWTGIYQPLIPIPWVDLTRSVEAIFPGALFGIATDVSPLVSGLVVPFPIVVSMVIASFAFYFFGNWLSVIYRLSPDVEPLVKGYQSWWYPAMNLEMAWPRCTMYLWASIIIGMGFAVGFAPIARHPRRFFGAFKALFRPKSSAEKGEERLTDPISFLKIGLPLMVFGSMGGIALFLVLVPDFAFFFPWILVLIAIGPLITTIIQGRMYGVTGQVTDPVQRLQSLIYYASGYPGIDIWFAPNLMTQQANMLNSFKMCELTETKTSNYIKIRVLIIPISILIGYFFMELFWRLAPIPSGRYPGVSMYWPIDAVMTSVWIKGRVTGLLRLDWLIYSFVLGSGIYLVLDLTHCPLSFIGMGAGMGMITPVAITMLIGGIVGQVISRKWKAWWNENRRIVAGGILVGEGIAVIISVSVALLIQSIWTMPY